MKSWKDRLLSKLKQSRIETSTRGLARTRFENIFVHQQPSEIVPCELLQGASRIAPEQASVCLSGPADCVDGGAEGQDVQHCHLDLPAVVLLEGVLQGLGARLVPPARGLV